MATKSSDLRKKYGVNKAPIPATRAFVKPLDHFQDQGIDGKAWILFNEDEGTRVSVNTYNGNAGKGFRVQTHGIPADEKEIAILTKGYTEVKVSDCPVAEGTKAKAKSKKAEAVTA